MANTRKGLSRRTMTLLIMLMVATVIGTLIAYEQVSILYVLCTLALVALLLVVSFADLETVNRTDTESET